MAAAAATSAAASTAASGGAPKDDLADPIYLDYNATTPVDPRVGDAMIPFIRTHFGNPSSTHVYGRRAKAALQRARGQVAAMLHASPDEITFTSGGTECINWVLKGSIDAHRKRRRAMTHGDDGRLHVISSHVEHPATLNTLAYLRDECGVDVTLLSVASDGHVRPDDVVKAVVPGRTCLITLMQANNEVGALTPIGDVVKAVKAGFPDQLITFHADSSQAIGKVPVHVEDLGVDYVTVAGHKVYATKGAGALYMRKGAEPYLDCRMHGGGQEGGRRCGTENVILDVALGEACEIAEATLAESMAKSHAMWTRMRHALTALCTVTPKTNGPDDKAQRLPNTLSIGFPGAASGDLLDAIRDFVACGAGAACHSGDGDLKMSHVLRQMGVEEAVGIGTIRISVGRYTTNEEIDTAARIISAAVNVLVAGGTPHGAHMAAAAAAAAGTSGAGASAATAGAVAGAGAGAGASGSSSGSGSDAAPALPLPATEARYKLDTYNFDDEATVVATFGPESTPEGWAQGGFPSIVVTSSTVFHSQGGGQPSDRGLMALNPRGAAAGEEAQAGVTVGDDGALFAVGLVKPAPDGSGALLHYGYFVGERSLSPERVAPKWNDSLAAPAAATFGAGATVRQVICAKWRRACARMHSAGHLLDSAMTNLGFPLPAGKGYHFLDGPFVEYVGTVDADARNDLPQRLQEECARLIANNVATDVATAVKGSPELEALGISPEDVSGLPDGTVVRVVKVGGSVACPCGGTHVKSSGEIKAITIGKIKVKKGNTQVKYSLPELGLEGVAVK